MLCVTPHIKIIHQAWRMNTGQRKSSNSIPNFVIFSDLYYTKGTTLAVVHSCCSRHQLQRKVRGSKHSACTLLLIQSVDRTVEWPRWSQATGFVRGGDSLSSISVFSTGFSATRDDLDGVSSYRVCRQPLSKVLPCHKWRDSSPETYGLFNRRKTQFWTDEFIAVALYSF